MFFYINVATNNVVKNGNVREHVLKHLVEREAIREEKPLDQR